MRRTSLHSGTVPYRKTVVQSLGNWGSRWSSSLPLTPARGVQGVRGWGGCSAEWSPSQSEDLSPTTWEWLSYNPQSKWAGHWLSLSLHGVTTEKLKVSLTKIQWVKCIDDKERLVLSPSFDIKCCSFHKKQNKKPTKQTLGKTQTQ